MKKDIKKCIYEKKIKNKYINNNLFLFKKIFFILKLKNLKLKISI